MPKEILLSLSTFALALIGAFIFNLLNLPLPFLLGPMFICLIAALAGVPMRGAGYLGKIMRTILGVAIGASVTPEIFSRIVELSMSVALVPIVTAIVGGIGYFIMRKLYNFDPATSYYSAMPGGLQDMLLFGEEAGGNIRTLSLIQATRVLIIVSSAPWILSFFWGLNLTGQIGQSASQVPVIEIGLMVIAAIIGWAVATVVKLPGASILGPLILTAALSLTGVIHHRPPSEAIVAAQLFIGLAVGSKYTGITFYEVRRDVSAGVLFSIILVPIGLLFAMLISTAGLASPVDAFLAFSPGGQAEMAVLAILVSADVPFIVSHHLVRIFFVITASPLVFNASGVNIKNE